MNLIDNLTALEEQGALIEELRSLPPSVWECNECGSQEYPGNFSEEDMQHLRCSACGGDEWHQAVPRD